MANEEINEVDMLVEDIAEEIRDLNIQRNSTEAAGCKMSANSIVCEPSVIENKFSWQTSRSTIKQQIRQLRTQLKELKQIRKYLGRKKPISRNVQKKRLDKSFPFVGPTSETCVCERPKTKEDLKEKLKAEREAKRTERKLERLRRKEQKRIKMEKKNKRKLKRQDHCKTDIKMNCFR